MVLLSTKVEQDLNHVAMSPQHPRVTTWQSQVHRTTDPPLGRNVRLGARLTFGVRACLAASGAALVLSACLQNFYPSSTSRTFSPNVATV